jgi:2-phospho-L-lactate/phosphoenolpyruvate guanylyltransferase
MTYRISGRRDLWAVVPVKLFDRSKRRLMPLLSGLEREALARAMLEDVLGALMHASSLAGVMVVTGDRSAAAIARAAGALVVTDLDNAGMTAAVTSAARYLAAMGRAGMLVVPADVPLITHQDVETVISAHRAAPSVTLVPAATDGGTNALVCSPPEVIPISFGEDSFRRHQGAARAIGIEPRVLRLERAGRDIDRPEDLATFLQAPSPTRTYACLVALGFPERLRNARRDRSDTPTDGAIAAMDKEAMSS